MTLIHNVFIQNHLINVWKNMITKHFGLLRFTQQNLERISMRSFLSQLYICLCYFSFRTAYRFLFKATITNTYSYILHSVFLHILHFTKVEHDTKQGLSFSYFGFRYVRNGPFHSCPCLLVPCSVFGRFWCKMAVGVTKFVIITSFSASSCKQTAILLNCVDVNEQPMF